MSNARVVVIAKDIVDDLFPFEYPLGKFIKIAGVKFKVIGTFEDLGTRTFGQSTNNRAVIPITAFEDLYGKYRSVYLTIQAIDASQIDEAKSQVIGVLRQLRKIPPGEDNDFAMWSNESLVESFQNTAEMVQLVAILLGLISLVVGSIGVMNIMLVSVTERTREIGIRKAIGATPKKIRQQFLIEAIVICILGGIAGVIMGILIGNFLAGIIASGVFVVPWMWIVIGFTICILVGLISGSYPAFKASKLDPIESLRFE